MKNRNMLGHLAINQAYFSQFVLHVPNIFIHLYDHTRGLSSLRLSKSKKNLCTGVMYFGVPNICLVGDLFVPHLKQDTGFFWPLQKTQIKQRWQIPVQCMCVYVTFYRYYFTIRLTSLNLKVLLQGVQMKITFKLLYILQNLRILLILFGRWFVPRS